MGLSLSNQQAGGRFRKTSQQAELVTDVMNFSRWQNFCLHVKGSHGLALLTASRARARKGWGAEPRGGAPTQLRHSRSQPGGADRALL